MDFKSDNSLGSIFIKQIHTLPCVSVNSKLAASARRAFPVDSRWL